MSKRYKKQRRLRYYRRHPELIKKFAEYCGLELCGYTGECDQCQSPRPDAPVWVLMCRGEETEVSEVVCHDCVPRYYFMLRGAQCFWGSREYDRWQRNSERTYQAIRRDRRWRINVGLETPVKYRYIEQHEPDGLF